MTIAASATSVVPPSFDELVNESDYIVRAVVKSVSSEWREQQGHRHIYTLVELDVREVIAGTPPQPLILQILGGRIGDQELVLEGAPKFTQGDEDILFVRGNGQNIYPLVAMMHGRYPILRDASTGEERVMRSNRAPLTNAAQVSLPLADAPTPLRVQGLKTDVPALTAREFVRLVKLKVNPAYRRRP